MIVDLIAGNNSRLPFNVIVSIRSQFLDRPTSTFLTMLALASSVAMATAVEMSTRSLRAPLEQTTEALVGAAELSVVGGTMGVVVGENLELIDQIRSLPSVDLASPIINRTFRIDGGDLDGKPLRLLGIDLLADSAVRSFGVTVGNVEVRDPLRLLGQDNAIIVSRSVAQKLGLADGDKLHLRSGSSKAVFTVHGILDGSLARAYGGELAVLDLFTLQDVLQTSGRVDRVDISISSDADIDDAKREIAQTVGDGAGVVEAALGGDYAESVMRTVNMGIWSLAAVAILLSSFLTFAIASLVVDRRTAEFSLLRMAGMEDRLVVRMLLVDMAILSVAATMIGFGAGAFLADPLVDVFSRASEFLSDVRVPASTVSVTTVLVAACVGPPVALVAAMEPALRSVRSAALAWLQLQHGPVDHASRSGLWVAVASAAMLAIAMTGQDLMPGDLRVPIVIVSSVVLVGTGLPQVLLRNYRACQRVLGGLIPRVGYLVSSSILDRPRETGATMAVWAAVSAALVAAPSMVTSLIGTMDEAGAGWRGENAILARASFGDSFQTERLSEETLQAIRNANGVDGVDDNAGIEVVLEGSTIPLYSVPTDLFSKYGDLSRMFRDLDQSMSALREGKLLMTRSLSRNLGLGIGDLVTLRTKYGLREFEIGGFFRAFVAPRGALAFDTEEFKRWFDLSAPRAVVFWTSPDDRERVLSEISRATSSPPVFLYGSELRNLNRRIIEQYEDLLLVPVCLVAVLGGLSLMGLLFGNITARGREMALLNAAGAIRRDRIVVVWADGVLVGLSGAFAGLLLSVFWTSVLIDRAGVTLGFESDLMVHWPAVLMVSGGAILLSGAVSIGPASSVARKAGFGGLLRTE